MSLKKEGIPKRPANLPEEFQKASDLTRTGDRTKIDEGLNKMKRIIRETEEEIVRDLRQISRNIESK